HARRARTNLNRFHEFPGLDRRREEKIPKQVRPRRRNREGPRRIENHVWRTELPAFGKAGWRRGLGGRPLGCSSGGPLAYDANLCRSQAPLVGEVAVARLRKPGRHVTAAGSGSDIAGVAFGIGITQQRKRPRLARPMAGSAMLIKDRRNVVRESR